jgi:hypothetical protein
MKFLLILFIVSTSFAQSPGKVTVSVSKLDGEKQVTVEPAWLYTGGLTSDLKLGGVWSSKSETNFFIDVLQVQKRRTDFLGVEKRQNMDALISGIKIGVDGNVHEFKPVDAQTGYVPGLGRVENSTRFSVPLELVQQMVSGSNVIVQAQLPGKWVEGQFTFNQMMYARGAIKKALEKINGKESDSSDRKIATPRAGKSQ